MNWFEHAGARVGPGGGHRIYTGLLTDTGGFRYSNTSPNVMADRLELLDRGVDGTELAERLLERDADRAAAHVCSGRLSRLRFTAENRRSAGCRVSGEDLEETGASGEDLEGLVNYPRNIEGVEVGMLFKEMDDGTVKVSLRSAGKATWPPSRSSSAEAATSGRPGAGCPCRWIRQCRSSSTRCAVRCNAGKALATTNGTV